MAPAERMAASPAYAAFADKLEGDPNRQRLWAAVGGGNAEAAKAEARAKMQALVASADVYSRVPSEAVLGMILKGGFKNQFQVGKSAALYDPRGRIKAEAGGMGLPPDAPPEGRPIYGYLSDGSVPPGEEAAANYGGVVVKMKPSVKGRATVTMGDSFSGATNGDFQASPMDKVSHNSISPAALANVGMDSLDSFAKFNSTHRTYIEAHMHGGVGPQDIESVQFRGEPSPDMARRLEAMGIPWSSY